MPRSNAPQALSVVSVTHEGSAELTAREIRKFDQDKFGFSHDRTWASMSKALTGTFDAASVKSSFGATHPRVIACIAALCALGREAPRRTFALRDYPDAEIKEVEGLRLEPDVTIAARASCWYLDGDEVVLPLLQPRSSQLIERKMAIYAALGRRAFCRGGWADARVEIVNLTPTLDDGIAVAQVYREDKLPVVSDDELNRFLRTYLDGQKLAAKMRAAEPTPEKKPRKDRPSTSGDLFGTE